VYRALDVLHQIGLERFEDGTEVSELGAAHVFLALFWNVGGELFADYFFGHVQEPSVCCCKEAIKYQKYVAAASIQFSPVVCIRHHWRRSFDGLLASLRSVVGVGQVEWCAVDQ
jgi:hypothetical protein